MQPLPRSRGDAGSSKWQKMAVYGRFFATRECQIDIRRCLLDQLSSARLTGCEAMVVPEGGAAAPEMCRFSGLRWQTAGREPHLTRRASDDSRGTLVVPTTWQCSQTLVLADSSIRQHHRAAGWVRLDLTTALGRWKAGSVSRHRSPERRAGP